MDIGVWPATGTMDSLCNDLDKWTSGLQDLIAKLAPYADGFQPVFAKVQNIVDRNPFAVRKLRQQTEENRKQLSGMEEELEKCPDITAKFEKENLE